MGQFDFLSDAGMANSVGSPASGVMGMVTKLLQDPNVLHGMGNAGAALSNGASFGEAFNPAEMIRNIQQQKATQQLLSQLIGGEKSSSALTPTPKGTPGPDAVTTTRTADGTVTTIKEPSAANLSTYGTTVPPESVKATGASNLPFWQTLFSK